MIDNRNTILAVILSGLVLIGWQYFFNLPQMEKRRAAEQAQSELVKPAPQNEAATTPQGGAPRRPPMRRRPSRPPRRSSTATPPLPRRHASRSTPRGFPAASR